jgi:hypothetical protein
MTTLSEEQNPSGIAPADDVDAYGRGLGRQIRRVPLKQPYPPPGSGIGLHRRGVYCTPP